MAQTMASMPGLRGTSPAAAVEGSRPQLGGSTRLNFNNVLLQPRPSKVVARPVVTVRAAHQAADTHEPAETSRRAMLGLVAAGLASGAFVQAVLAEALPIKIGPPPLPSGGLPGTLNSDQPRDLDLPLKNRFFIQPLPPAEAAARAKESARDIVGVKKLIDKKAWPYVQNDLRLKAEYLRYDLNTVISAKPKEEKKVLKELTGKLFETISQLDHAAKTKSTPEAEKYYAKAVSTLDDVLAKLG